MSAGSGPELPSGTVTFLFTDIEGSTGLLKRLGDRYAGVLDDHHRLLREAFVAHGGREMDTQGDSFFFVFARAKHSIQAAIDAQRTLAAHDWPEGAEVRVRMGLHSGEPLVGEDRYVGIGVNRAARIGAAAHGGQVLVSDATRALVEDDLPEDVFLRDLGSFRLKDIDRPERISQLAAEGLPVEFPPLRGGAERVKSPPVLRRRSVLAAALVGVIAAAVAIPVFAFGGEGGSVAAAVQPNTVAAIDPKTGAVVADLPVGSRPGPITAGDGALWVGNLDDKTVTHIDPKTRKVVVAVPLSGTPAGLAASKGRLWVAAGDQDQVYRIDSQYDRVTGAAHVAPGFVISGLGRRAVAARGSAVWVANYDSTAVQIDAATLRTRKPIVVGGNQSLPGVAIAFGSVWDVSDNDKVITRIDPSTGTVIQTIPFGDAPSAIAVGAGAVWVADRWDDRVARIDPAKNDVEFQIPVGRHPTGLAVGAGRVWVANSRAGTVSEIDPEQNKVVRTITLGESPTGVAVANGLVWVTVSANLAARVGTAAAGGTAHLDRSVEDISPDPAVGFINWQLTQATCLKLINYPDLPSPAGSRLIPEAARAWPKVTDGGRTYTFAIRPGFRFSPTSNEAVTAATFKYSMERALSPKETQGYIRGTGYVDAIVGAKAHEEGKATQISGIVAHGNTLTIRLEKPLPDLPAKLAMAWACAVPIGTPTDPSGLPILPAAGPYYVASHTPGEQLVLKRNPNYHGPRPHHLAEIDIALDVAPSRSMADVESGSADYNFGDVVDPATDPTRLRKLYGPGSPAAKNGHQRWFENPTTTMLWMSLNTSRPLFASVRMRQAFNFAIDRTALAKLLSPPAIPTDHYLPPGMPGYRAEHVYPLHPDLARARQLAGPGKHGTAIVYTNSSPIGKERAQIAKQALAAIGIDAQIQTFPTVAYFPKVGTKGEPFDIGVCCGWGIDYLDPSGMLAGFDGRLPFEQQSTFSHFNSSDFNTRLDAASRLTGTARYRALGRLDVDLARHDAPVAAWGVLTSGELFSARVGCQVFQPIYGATDLAAMCIRP